MVRKDRKSPMPPAFLFLIPAMSNSRPEGHFLASEAPASSARSGGLYSRRILRQHPFVNFVQSVFSHLKISVLSRHSSADRHKPASHQRGISEEARPLKTGPYPVNTVSPVKVQKNRYLFFKLQAAGTKSRASRPRIPEVFPKEPRI